MHVRVGDHVYVNNSDDADDNLAYIAKITRLFDSGRFTAYAYDIEYCNLFGTVWCNNEKVLKLVECLGLLRF